MVIDTPPARLQMNTKAFLTLWFLASQSWCLVISYESTLDLTLKLGESSFVALFSSVPLDDENIPIVGELLTSPYSNLKPYYGFSCANRADLQFVLQNLDNIAEPIRDALLDWSCLVHTPMVRAQALSRQLPTAVPPIRTLWSQEEWIVAFKTAQHPSDWCISMPDNFLKEDVLGRIDLVSHLQKSCLKISYNRKRSLLAALHRQLKCASEELLTRFLIEFRGIWLDMTVHEILTNVVCNSESTTEKAALNAALRYCPGLSKEASTVVDKAQALLQGNSSTTYKLYLLGLLVKNMSIPAILATVEPQRLPAVGVSYRDVHQFAVENLSNARAEDKQKLLDLLGIQYRKTLLNFSTPMSLLMEQSTLLRLAFYRRWYMRPASPGLKPLYYLNVQMGTLKVMLDYLVSLTGYVRNGNVFRPKLWLDSKQLETVLNLLIYSLVRFGSTPIRLDPEFCTDFGRKYFEIDFPPHFIAVLGEPLARNTLEMQSTRIQEQFQTLWTAWGLYGFLNRDLCSALSAPV